MSLLLSTPIWLFALVVAGIAPWCVRAFADALERSVRVRTAVVLARAGVVVTSKRSKPAEQARSPEGSP